VDRGADLTSGRTYQVKVLLRRDGGGTTVDTYNMEVTVP
jgi:hypothetical protein